jgi:hypothetical protein
MMTVQNLRQHGRNTLICQRIHNERNIKDPTKKEGRLEDFVLAKDIKVIYMVPDSPKFEAQERKGEKEGDLYMYLQGSQHGQQLLSLQQIGTPCCLWIAVP